MLFAAESTTPTDIERQINELRSTIQQQQLLEKQQTQLDKLQSERSQPSPQDALPAKNNKEQVGKESSSFFRIDDTWGSFKLSGDVRFRFQNRTLQETGAFDCFRTRFRLGTLWQSRDKKLEIGFGVASEKSSNNTFATWAEDDRENFGAMSLDIDFLYARHYFDTD